MNRNYFSLEHDKDGYNEIKNEEDANLNMHSRETDAECILEWQKTQDENCYAGDA